MYVTRTIRVNNIFKQQKWDILAHACII